MKKFLFFAIVFFSGFLVNAQVNPFALGLRLGGNGDINGGEISYQQGISDVNRLELDLGFGGNRHHSRLAVTGIYQWVWNLNDGLNWFAGPGASVGLYSDDDHNGYLNIALGGQIGLEYDFGDNGVPLLLSLDIRPMWDFLGDNPGLGWGLALGIRYVWGK